MQLYLSNCYLRCVIDDIIYLSLFKMIIQSEILKIYVVIFVGLVFHERFAIGR